MFNEECVDMSWDARWVSLAQLIASWSKDRSRRAGAVIVDERNVVVALGWNGFPRGIDEDVDARQERPAKYLWTEHAERNAIYNAAANGHHTRGCRMYINWFPCADCARAIIQAGIVEVVGIEPDWDDFKWKDHFAIIKEMFSEAGISLRFYSFSAV